MKAAALLTATVMAFAAPVAGAADRKEEAEARLAKMLEGRVAGEPVSCITTFRSDRLQVMEHVGLVYDAGDVIYVARAKYAEDLDHDNIVIMERTGSQVCNTDIIRTIDRATGFHTGVVFIEHFVPYRKEK